MSTYTLIIDSEVQDLASRRISLERLSVGWRTGRQLVFRQHLPHHQADFHLEQEVLLRVDGEVVFRGRIRSVTCCGEPNGEYIEYLCHGLRALSRRITVCDADGLPKLVWNAEPDDEDYDPQRVGFSVGRMIAEVIDLHASALRELGVIEGTGYLQEELDLLDAVPSRVVLRECDLDRAIVQLLAHQPDFLFQIHPGQRQFRFYRASDLPSRTLTLGADQVAENLLTPDLSTRYTAVKIVGEEEMVPTVVSVSDGGLLPEWDQAREADWTLAKALAPADTDQGSISSYDQNHITDLSKSWSQDRWAGGRVVLRNSQTGLSQTLTVLSNSSHTLTLQGTITVEPDSYTLENGVSDYRYVFSRWRIADPDKRRIAPVIPGGTFAPVGWMVFQRTYKPTVCERRDFGGGAGYFYRQAEFDLEEGRFLTAHPLARGDLDQPGAASGPDDVVLIYAYRSQRLVARYPEEGFAGSAYTRFGLQREKVIYDEQLVSADDLPRYRALAEALHRALAEVVYQGRISLLGLDWSLCHLGERINIAGQDRQGNAVSTGWEDINALLDRVVYRFAKGLTELDLTTDTSDLSLPYAELRQRLRTRERLREVEADLRHLRRRLRRTAGSPPPDPEALHRGYEAVESLSAGQQGQRRHGHIILQSDDGSVLITNPFADDEHVFDLAVGPHQHPDYIRADGSVAFTGDQSMGRNRLTDLADPIDQQDAATRNYVDLVAQGLVGELVVGGESAQGSIELTSDDGSITITLDHTDNSIDFRVTDAGLSPSKLQPGAACQILHTAQDGVGWTSNYVRSIAHTDNPDLQRTGDILIGSLELPEAEEDWDRWVQMAWEGNVALLSAAAPVVVGGNIANIRSSLKPGEFFVWEP